MRTIDTTSYENNIERRFAAVAETPCRDTGRAVSQAVLSWVLAIAENIEEAYEVLEEFRREASDGMNAEELSLINALTDAVRRRIPENYSRPIFEPEGIFA